ncbi:MAG: trypsin-like peptidase domain-containing protein, partial [Bacteroidota bacterium]
MTHFVNLSDNRRDLQDNELLDSYSKTLIKVVDEVAPSVVKIEVKANRRGKTTPGSGSGFVFSSDGNIITNSHVVTGAEDIKVLFNNGNEVGAALVGNDPDTDIAVIKPFESIGISRRAKSMRWGQTLWRID